MCAITVLSVSRLIGLGLTFIKYILKDFFRFFRCFYTNDININAEIMKKTVFLFAVCTSLWFSSMAQQHAVAVNYLNLGKLDDRGWNSGVGVQAKFHLKNSWYLIPDVGYFFEKTNLPYHKDDNNFQKDSHQYLFGNVNVGYSFSLSNRLKLVPYIGTGFYQDFIKHLHVSSGSDNGYRDPSSGTNPGYPPHNILDEYSDSMIMLNLGFLAEYNITKNMFLTAGSKYMLDSYSQSSYIPYLNFGMGCRF